LSTPRRPRAEIIGKRDCGHAPNDGSKRLLVVSLVNAVNPWLYSWP